MAKRTPKLERIAKKGEELEILRALRQKLAATIDESNSGRDIAALSRQLQIVIARIRDLEIAAAAAAQDEDIEAIIRRHAAQRVRGDGGRLAHADINANSPDEDSPDEDSSGED